MILFAIWISVFCVAISQEASVPMQGYNASDMRFGAIEDNGPRTQSNLWLISRDDPIPVTLNRRVAAAGGFPTENGAYGTRLSSSASNLQNSRDFDAAQSAVPQHSPIPIYYQEVGNGRQGLGNDFNAPGSVLVELPADITEGLWVRQQPEQFLSTARNVDTDSANFRLEYTHPQRAEGVPLVYIPSRESVSQIPRSELPQSDPNPPQTLSYVELPYQYAPANQGPLILNEANQGPLILNEANQPEVTDNLWSVREDQSYFYPADNFTSISYVPYNSTQGVHDTHGYGVLTSEDIELLERLGILSAVVIESLHPENATANFTSPRQSLREVDSAPIYIDHGGQKYFQTVERDSESNLSDVVLIDVPNFTTSGYSVNLPENIGVQDSSKNFTLSPLRASVPEVKKENGDLSNDTHLTDRQILEILQLLSITGDIQNSSSASPVSPRSEGSAASYSESSGSGQALNASYATEKPAAESSTTTSPASTVADQNPEEYKPHPSVVIERKLQPRLMKQVTAADNEIIKRLLTINSVDGRKPDDSNAVDVSPKPYLFGFKQSDGNGTLQHRSEKSDASGVVKGTYGYKDAFGVYRNVSYIADGNGFHAVVRTNEPGTVSHNTADAVFMSETPPLAALVRMMAYKRIKDLLNATETE